MTKQRGGRRSGAGRPKGTYNRHALRPADAPTHAFELSQNHEANGWEQIPNGRKRLTFAPAE